VGFFFLFASNNSVLLLGSLLLLVNNYASSPDRPLITDTALGVLLLIIAALLAYSGNILFTEI